MSSVTKSVDVAVPVRTAYDQWTQFEEFPRFMKGVREVRQISDTMTHWVVEVGTATREFDAEITEQHPDERVAWRSVDGPRHAGVITFHRLEANRTRVTAQMDLDPDGFFETVGDKLGVVDRRVQDDLDQFREFTEQRGVETGSWRGDVAPPAP
jgi:uncharacterized membrane protein